MRTIIKAITILLLLTGSFSCVKIDKGPYPLPLLTFDNNYNATSYFKLSRVYQDTTVLLTNKIIITANCASLAGVKNYQVTLNGNVIKKETLQFQDFNQEIDTMYLPQQTPHSENWEYSFTDMEGRSVSKQIHITVK